MFASWAKAKYSNAYTLNREQCTACVLDTCKDDINYDDIVRIVIDAIHEGDGDPNPNAIHEIDDGDYQGTLLFVIPADDYQP